MAKNRFLGLVLMVGVGTLGACGGRSGLTIGSDAGIGDGSSSNNSRDGALADAAVLVRDGSPDQPTLTGYSPDVASIGKPSADAPVIFPDASPISADSLVGVTPILTSIGITPPAITLVVGVPNSTLVVTAVYSDGTTKDVTSSATFTSSDATVLTVSGHTITGVKAGTATLTAVSSGQTATAKVTVSASALQSISINSVTPVSVGQSILVTATAIFADGTKQDVTAQATWTSSDATVAAVALDATSGEEKVSGIKAGSATLKATLQGVSGQASVAVTSVLMTSINITPTQSVLQRGVTQSFQATATYQDSTTADVTQQATWLSSDTTVATITVSSSGVLVTAVGIGTGTITATVGTIVGTTTVTVTAPALSTVVVTPAIWTPNVGGLQSFTAQATYADNSTADVTLSATWASSATSIVGISNASGQQGQATALAAGSATISATLSGIVGSATVTVSSSRLVSIAVAPNPADVVVGLSLPLKATGTYQNGTTQDLTAQVAWTVLTTAMASISNAAGSSGQVTGIAAGTTTATATLNGIVGTTTVNVSVPTLQSITVSPAAPPSVAAGVSQPFTASASFGNGTSLDVTTQVTWSSSNIAVAQISNASGSNGVASTLTAGTSNITATLNGVSSAPVTLAVTAPALSTITISPATASIIAGATQVYTATAVFQNGTTAAITATSGTWTSSNTAAATISTVGGGGFAPAREVAAGVAAGTSTIMLSYQGMTASAQLTVTAAVTLVQIAVSPQNPASILVGATQQFTATAITSDGNTQTITTNAQTQWTTSDATIASITSPAAPTDGGAGFTRPAGGLATGIGAGTVTITVTYGGQSATATLTVRAPQPTGMVITPSAPPSIRVGATQQFQAVVTFDDGTTQTVTTQASWTSSSATVASVSTTGAVTGRGGAGAGAGGLATAIGAGTTTITATYSTFTASATLTVVTATPVSLVVTPPSPTLYVSQAQAMVATVVYADNTTAVVTGTSTWSSSDPTVATVTTPAGGGGFPGGGGGGVVTAVGTGTATVTASYGTLVGTATITVTAPALTYVQVTPTNPSITAQATAQFTATAVFADNSTRNVTSSSSWTSSNSTVAVVSNSGATIGRATGLGAGTSTITATYQGMSGSSVLSVAQGVGAVSVSPVLSTTVLGIPVTFTATATLTNDATVTPTGVAWVSSDPTIATITAAGVATPVKAGTATITATYLGVSGTASLTVSSATLSSISITPNPVTVTVDGSAQLTATGVYSDSTKVDLTNVATWTSSATSVASVSNAAGSRGLLTGLDSGTATVTVYFGAASATDSVTVSP